MPTEKILDGVTYQVPSGGDIFWGSGSDGMSALLIHLIDKAAAGTPWINVQDSPYGAAGDGVTDDTNAIRAAFAAAYPVGHVHFPVGSYRITKPIWLGYFSTSGNGQGSFTWGSEANQFWGGTVGNFPTVMVTGHSDPNSGTSQIIYDNDTYQCPVFFCMGQNIYFDSIRIVGNGGSVKASEGIFCTGGTSHLTLLRCSIESCVRGIRIGNRVQESEDPVNFKNYENQVAPPTTVGGWVVDPVTLFQTDVLNCVDSAISIQTAQCLNFLALNSQFDSGVETGDGVALVSGQALFENCMWGGAQTNDIHIPTGSGSDVALRVIGGRSESTGGNFFTVDDTAMAGSVFWYRFRDVDFSGGDMTVKGAFSLTIEGCRTKNVILGECADVIGTYPDAYQYCSMRDCIIFGQVGSNHAATAPRVNFKADNCAFLQDSVATPWQSQFASHGWNSIENCRFTGDTYSVANTFVAGHSPWYDVKAFGATGDGSTDDTAAIQAAIDACVNGVVFLPPGNYRITDSLVIRSVPHHQGLVLRGSGHESNYCTIEADMALEALDIAANRVLVEQIQFLGNNQTTQGTIGIQIRGGNTAVIQHCRIEDFSSSGVEFNDVGNSNFCTLRHLIIDSNGVGIRVPVRQVDKNAIRVEHCNVTGSTSHGLLIKGSWWVVEGGQFTNNGDYAIRIGEDGDSLTSTMNHIRDVTLENNTNGGYIGSAKADQNYVNFYDVSNASFNQAAGANDIYWKVDNDEGGDARLYLDGRLQLRGPDPWYDVKAYGAAGDGTTDDTTAIQAAIDACDNGTVFFPLGNYRITSSIVLRSAPHQQGIRLFGACKEGKVCTIQADVALEAIDVPAARVIIENLQILGNEHTTQGTIGIQIRGGNHALIRNCRIEDFSTAGIEFNGTGNSNFCKIEHCIINSNGVGIKVPTKQTNIDGVSVEHCNIDGNTSHGILIKGSRWIVQGGTIANNGGYGIQISESGDSAESIMNHVRDVTFTNNTSGAYNGGGKSTQNYINFYDTSGASFNQDSGSDDIHWKVDDDAAGNSQLRIDGSLVITKRISTPPQSVVASTSTVSIDWAEGFNINLLLQTSITTLNLSNPRSGERYVFKITQDATGGRTISGSTWSSIRWRGSIPPTLSPAANSEDIIVLYYDGSSYYGEYSLNYG